MDPNALTAILAGCVMLTLVAVLGWLAMSAHKKGEAEHQAEVAPRVVMPPTLLTTPAHRHQL